MDNLTMDLVHLTKRNRDGSSGTQKNRQRGLTAMAAELKHLGYTLKTARSIKPKHINALVEHWRDTGLTKATIRNRMSWLRWWAQKVDKISILDKDNATYELNDDRTERTNIAFSLHPDQLNALTDRHVQAAVMLQAAFGLRRQEAMKIIPKDAIKADSLKLKGSWTKGGRPRTIPITSQHQRVVLLAIRQIVEDGSLVPTERSYAQHMRIYERQVHKAGIARAHGLRHKYAQARCEKLTGMKCPINGGPDRSLMSEDQYELDRQARQRISKELGHNRIEITDVYLGRLQQGGAVSCS
ncbi:putative integrase [Roseobacter sp. MED193]|uniref:phage integrase N-terminal domain-containing protein n=1 Tax=Roseobacter sp. MED193 TaxID=314262 RepID=UPI000068EDF9|nr:phage integrase N-terminal domain-containing protein [Roseobacter sp. MED193]EAQ45976.1 putative integrase [Roseobacter sp. MED193]